MFIYSKIDSGLLLHGIYRRSELTEQSETRIDFASPSDSLQIASLRLKETNSFKPHYHLDKALDDYKTKAQECWVVVDGSVRVTYFDIDNSFLADSILFPGDISFTFNGGHGYEVLESESLFYEFKSGPYLGTEEDKKYIEF